MPPKEDSQVMKARRGWDRVEGGEGGTAWKVERVEGDGW